jgi:glyoxylate/hydroxypyruvate reductase A
MREAQIAREWAMIQPGHLHGKTIAIAGLGSVGQAVVKRARAFSMRVLGLSATGRHADLVDHHFDPTQWIEMVSQADYLILILPLTKDTYHRIDHRVLKAMKKDAVLINVGRGALLQEEDLLLAMRTKTIRAAVLDVFEQEPLYGTHPLWDTPGITITPHCSGLSHVETVCDFFMLNFERFQQGQPLLGQVDIKNQY